MLRAGYEQPRLALAEDRCAIRIEGYKTRVEGCVPIGGEKKAVIDIEALGVVGAVSPGFDMAGTQKLRLRNPGDCAAPLPVVEQSGAKFDLPDPTTHERLNLCAKFLTDMRECILKAFQRRIRQSTGKPPDPPNKRRQIIGTSRNE